MCDKKKVKGAARRVASEGVSNTKKSTFDFAEINPLYRLRHAVGVAKVGTALGVLPVRPRGNFNSWRARRQ